MKTITIIIPSSVKHRNPVIRFGDILKKGGIHQKSRKLQRIDARKQIRSEVFAIE